MKLNRLQAIVLVLAIIVPLSACSRDPETAKRDHVARADSYVEQNKLPEAVIEYRNAINLDARFGEARFKLGNVYERQGDVPKAYNEFVRAADLLPDREDVQVKAARYLLLAQRYDDAKRIAEAVVKKNARNVDAQILLANSLAGLKDVPAAIAELESTIEIDPKRVDTYLNLAALQMVGKDPKKAESILREAITQVPGSVPARLALVNLYWASGDLVQAEALAKEALGLDPKSEVANRMLAAFYLRTGRIKEAEAPLRTLAESTKTASARLGLAEYYLSTGRSEEALPILNTLLTDKDGKTPASMLLARWEYANNQKEQAYKRLDDLLVQEAKNTRTLLLKAQLLGADGQVDKALASAQAAAAADPRLPAAQHIIGLLFLQKRDPDRALAGLQRGVETRSVVIAGVAPGGQAQPVDGQGGRGAEGGRGRGAQTACQPRCTADACQGAGA